MDRLAQVLADDRIRVLFSGLGSMVHSQKGLGSIVLPLSGRLLRGRVLARWCGSWR
jgi:hypothetical protein